MSARVLEGPFGVGGGAMLVVPRREIDYFGGMMHACCHSKLMNAYVFILERC